MGIGGRPVFPGGTFAWSIAILKPPVFGALPLSVGPSIVDIETVRERRRDSRAVEWKAWGARPVDLARSVGVLDVCVSDQTLLCSWFEAPGFGLTPDTV